ncbi:hypothetical protein HQ47_01775 [Porphyromonas macacae]|uniref:Radical SAM core domain-containing protein n=1 Tax=Porphyromonas macacae TaxID=28115 RepID=A0A0A2E971_9PORP|nr:radical SAM protein [Porphyromonas macacae]KGN75438.1 hypothetical protein HQ47_01775 [Porphyromonas macacae]
MKRSRYAIFYTKYGKFYIYHQLSKALIEVDTELYMALLNSQLEIIPNDIKEYLLDICILVDKRIEESDAVKVANYRCRYNTDYLRVTILPTLDCNFRCWYCYEEHKVSKMSKEGMSSIFEFIKREALLRSKKRIVLDWFGGEPLICFNNVIYPLSKQLRDWCHKHNICFHSMTTTNGSLLNENVALKMNEIGLTQFQITLDGGKEFHNKTRFSSTMKDSYSRIVKNIHIICRQICDSNVDLRINYTPENVQSLLPILDDFDHDVRHQIRISPHVVWQNSDKIMSLVDIIKRFTDKALEKGYSTTTELNQTRCTSCYTENADQYVINYDLSVYKCTARDFNEKFSIGKILLDGRFSPNGLYYKYLVEESPFCNEECLECEILPSCLYATSCLQKKIEGRKPSCCKKFILDNIHGIIERKISEL